MIVWLRNWYDITHDAECLDVVDLAAGKRVCAVVSMPREGSFPSKPYNDRGHGYRAKHLAESLRMLAGQLDALGEGQSPESVNNSAEAMKESIRRFVGTA